MASLCQHYLVSLRFAIYEKDSIAAILHCVVARMRGMYEGLVALGPDLFMDDMGQSEMPRLGARACQGGKTRRGFDISHA